MPNFYFFSTANKTPKILQMELQIQALYQGPLNRQARYQSKESVASTMAPPNLLSTQKFSQCVTLKQTSWRMTPSILNKKPEYPLKSFTPAAAGFTGTGGRQGKCKNDMNEYFF